MIRRILLGLALVVLAGIAVLYWYFGPRPELTVTTWSGLYGRAQEAAQMAPFQAGHRVGVHIAEWDGTLKDIKGDVVDFELPRVVEACQRGLLEKIDAASLPAGDDGTPARKDFVPGAIGPCWVGNNVYSQVIVAGNFAGAAPTHLADFFDREKFPGKRALKRGSGKYNLELALLADGVSPRDVYTLLSSQTGLRQAFAKLDSLGPDLVWYDRSSEALDMIKSGQAAFATALNQDAAGAPHVIWDHQLYEFDAFAIPAGDAQKDLAMDYIRFATGSKPLAGVAEWQPFGPARRSSWALVGKNPDVGTDFRPLLPTAHWDTAFAVDEDWWRAHGAAAEAAWRNWAH